MAESLKVLMMGGPRSGKTSALAGLVDSMINGEVNKLIAVKDVSEGNVIKQKLAQKVENLKLTLIQSLGRTIIVDDSKTDAYQNYTIEFAIPGTDNKMNIIFTDANGEFFETGREHDSEISQMVKDYDVFVIAIDTPGLMEAVNSDNPFVTEAINKAINNVNDIHNFITYLDDKDGADAKMVIFVPLKCERWAHANKLNEVSARVKEVYSTPIEALKQMKNVEIDILPVQTVGNIIFKEHLKSYICLSGDDLPKRCSLLDWKNRVRFADGTERPTDASDKFQLDPQSPIREGSAMLRPNSWFQVVSKDYSPHNCEQLAFYILRFVLSKYLFIKEVEEKTKEEKRRKRSFLRNALTIVIAVFSWPVALIYYVINRVVEYMGTISYDQLHSLINSINERHLIKTEGEGICCLKQSLLHI